MHLHEYYNTIWFGIANGGLGRLSKTYTFKQYAAAYLF